MQKRSINKLNNNDNSENAYIENISDLDNKNNRFDKTKNVSSFNKSISILSNTKNLSNLPLINQSISDCDFENLNKINNNLSIENNNENLNLIELKPINKKHTFHKSKSEIIPSFLEEIRKESFDKSNKKKENFFIEKSDWPNRQNSLNFDYKNFLANKNSKTKKNKKNNEENIDSKERQFTLGSNIISTNHSKKIIENYKKNRSKKFSFQFYSKAYGAQPSLIGEHLKNDELNNILANSPNENEEDFKLNFNFNNLFYGNLNKDLEVNIPEEKIKRKTLLSARTTKSLDNFLPLKDKYKQDREALKLERLEMDICLKKKEQEKTLSRNLITFSEQKLKKILRLIDFLIFFFVFCDVIFGVYANNRYISDLYDLNDRLVKRAYELDSKIIISRYVMLIIVCFIEVLLLMKFYFRLKLYRQRILASKKDTIFSSNIYKRLLAEMIIMSSFTPPHQNTVVSGEYAFGQYNYSLDSLIVVLKLIKLYYLILFIFRFSPWMSSRTAEIARRLKAAVKHNFAFKASLKANPIALMFFSFVFFILVFSVIYEACEFSLKVELQKASKHENHSHKGNKNFILRSYYEVIWLIIITMTTVGYGDNSPKTYFGKFICFIASVFGMIFVSMIVVRLGNLVELGMQEKKAFHAIQINTSLKEIENNAKRLIKGLFKLMLIKIKKKDNFNNGNK